MLTFQYGEVVGGSAPTRHLTEEGTPAAVADRYVEAAAVVADLVGQDVEFMPGLVPNDPVAGAVWHAARSRRPSERYRDGVRAAYGRTTPADELLAGLAMPEELAA